MGHPPDARVLIIVNCDDFGTYDGINAAVIESIEQRIASSCSLMVPCPSAPHAMHLLRMRPAISFGTHLMRVRDSIQYRWEPLTGKQDRAFSGLGGVRPAEGGTEYALILLDFATISHPCLVASASRWRCGP